MCGCMIMHAAMNHEGHQPASQPGNAPVVAAADRYRQSCAHCGFPLQEGFAFRPSCGANLRTSKCPACGQKVDPAWGACAYCGSPLGEAQKEQAAHH